MIEVTDIYAPNNIDILVNYISSQSPFLEQNAQLAENYLNGLKRIKENPNTHESNELMDTLVQAGKRRHRQPQK